MRRFIVIAPLLALLNGCWFDNAPEIYSVEISVSDVTGLASGKAVQICDFRGQTAIRHCILNLHISDSHLEVAAIGPDKSKIGQILEDPRFKNSAAGAALTKHEDIELEVILSAHGRKENRYNLTIQGETPWDVLETTTAVMDDGTKSYIVTDAELRDGKELIFNASPSEYIENYSKQYNAEMNRTFSCYTGDPNGCKLMEFVKVQPTNAYSQATLRIIWTPLDEDDLSKTDNVS